MIDDRTLDKLYRTIKCIPSEERKTCLSFLIMSKLFGSSVEEINQIACRALQYPEFFLKEFGKKWRTKFKKDIDAKKRKGFRLVLQQYCDKIIMARSIEDTMFKMEQCATKKMCEHKPGYSLLFKDKVTQSLFLSEVVRNIKKRIEDVHSGNYRYCKHDVEMIGYEASMEFMPDDSLRVRFKCTGRSTSDLRTCCQYSNEYYFRFNRIGRIVLTQKQRYDRNGRRLKCRG